VFEMPISVRPSSKKSRASRKMSVLLIDDIDAAYGDTTVLRGVSLAVAEGSVVVLLGPNGAGKTTLLRVAAGAIRATSGRVLFDGHEVTREEAHRRAERGVCYISEERAVFLHLSVRDNIRLFTSGAEDEALALAIEAFPFLGSRLDQLAGTMSGGEQQMLALSRAYVRRPRLILLDEVSMGLAPSIVDQIFDYLDRLKRTGASLLLVEQYVTRALAIADDVYLLQQGQVSFAGEPAELEGRDLFEQYLGVSTG
jgi:branched-chain amino acid transport system ATP-binding protein